jgi:membrane-associated phospholipid phosphatase
VLDGVGRVYLGVHWPSDVVGGWLLGVLLTVLAAGMFLRLHTPGSERGGRPTPDPSGRREVRSPEKQSPGGEV